MWQRPQEVLGRVGEDMAGWRRCAGAKGLYLDCSSFSPFVFELYTHVWTQWQQAASEEKVLSMVAMVELVSIILERVEWLHGAWTEGCSFA